MAERDDNNLETEPASLSDDPPEPNLFTGDLEEPPPPDPPAPVPPVRVDPPRALTTTVTDVEDERGVEVLLVDASGAAPTRSTPFPDVAGAVAGDDGSGPLALGVVNELPGDDYLDFFFEHCDWPGVQGCFRDAVFMTPRTQGSGPWIAGRPFHVRHGFVNDGPEPLGAGFDLVLYMTPMSGGPSEGVGTGRAATIRYTSDYVLRGTTDRCGPTYRSQTGPVTCEWFVHDFPDGLAAGRWAMWAMWEAPCRAWVDLGFTDGCTDPDEVLSMFSSGVDSPIDGR